MKPKLTTQILYYGYAPYGQVFWDQNETPITTIHENDGNFREEYMSSIVEHFNIKVKYVEKIPASIKEATKNYGVWDD
jgi:hypothetical protein